ncbi:AAA family ATPase, partial [Deinococcus oregonensis]
MTRSSTTQPPTPQPHILQAITLQGFKSFADRTRLEFGPGVSAVIGPNGSGKSNVVEAIRWATHGARARELRAGRGSELIFHGSGGKAPLGLAEVGLELHTPEGRVNLLRRVYRDGTGEQDLQGRPVRARDIQAALRGTGLGPGGLAVIGQGEVSGVVQAEGRTLLGYVQEAAGLSRAVAARQETEGRLREADTHLERLGLLLNERETALERLSRAAEDARIHRALSLRVLTLEDALKRERQDGLRREIAQASAEAAAAEARSTALAAEVQTAATAVENAREAAQTARARRDAFAGALDALRAARDAHAQAERYRAHLQSEAEVLTAERTSLPTTPPAEPAPDLAALTGTAAA